MDPQRLTPRMLTGLLAAALLPMVLVAVGSGPVSIAPSQVIGIIAHSLGLPIAGDFTAQQEAVLLAIRLPRVLFAIVVGAGLALAGAALQGLFRNPLADPVLIGVSAGASFAVATMIVVGALWLPAFMRVFGNYALPTAGFVGGLASTAIIYALAQVDGRTSLPTMLLAGIALNALAMAGIGAYSMIASDEQLRNLTFWNFGSLAGARWESLLTLTAVVAAGFVALARYAPALDALALGEAVAGQVGFEPQKVKRVVVVVAALIAGCAVAFSGIIGFVALVAPHIIRLSIGPGHRALLPAAALLGALLLVAADLVSRVVVTPAELPIGIVTAIIGVPFFLAILLAQRRSLG